jgi:hypothetical protein
VASPGRWWHLGLGVGALSFVSGLVLALVLPFHDRCAPVFGVNCIDEQCPVIVCMGWGLRDRVIVAVVGAVVGWTAVVIGVWSAYWADKRSSRRLFRA